MVKIKELINGEVERKFNLVEEKLRNSFGFMKKDNEQIRTLLNSLDGKMNSFSEKKLAIVEFEKKIKEIEDELKAKIAKSEKLNSEKESVTSDKIASLEKSISKKGLKDEVYGELLEKINEKFSEMSAKQKKELKDLKKDNTKKLNKEFDKYKERTEYLKKEFIMFKNEFVGLRKSMEDWKKQIAYELKELVEEKEEKIFVSIRDLKNQINSLKARNTVLTRELNSFKGKI